MENTTIAELLADQLRHRVRTTSESATFELAVDAALELERPQRAWRLVKLASRLRKEGQYDVALRVLDAAVALDASDETTRAAYVCAMGLHADRGELEVARTIGEQLRRDSVDVFLLKVLARVYYELWRSTSVEIYRDEWQRCGEALERLEESASLAERTGESCARVDVGGG